MTRYCAFFGSINVGGNRLKMTDLRYALEREDFENVETVIASGNVLLDFDDRPSAGLEEMLAYVMREHFDIESFVAVRTRDELRGAIEQNPFVGDGEDAQVHTLFLEGQPSPARFEDMMTAYAGRGEERLAMGDRCLFIDYCHGVGDSRLTGAFMERRLGLRGTARNVRSLARILAKM